MMLEMIRPALDRRASRAIAQAQMCATLIEEALAAPLPEQERRHLRHAFVVIDAGKLFTASVSGVIDQALYSLASALEDDAVGVGMQAPYRQALRGAFDALFALAGMLALTSDGASFVRQTTTFQAAA